MLKEDLTMYAHLWHAVGMEHQVACAECGLPITLGKTDPDTLVDRRIMKNGELAYIEIVHKTCDGFRKHIEAGGTLD